MSQENIIKLLAGANMMAKKASQSISEKAKDCIESNIIKGNYVQREEFDQLRKLVLTIEKKLRILEEMSK